MARAKIGRCFTCKNCLKCVLTAECYKHITENRITEICKLYGGYQSVYANKAKKEPIVKIK